MKTIGYFRIEPWLYREKFEIRGRMRDLKRSEVEVLSLIDHFEVNEYLLTKNEISTYLNMSRLTVHRVIEDLSAAGILVLAGKNYYRINRELLDARREKWRETV